MQLTSERDVTIHKSMQRTAKSTKITVNAMVYLYNSIFVLLHTGSAGGTHSSTQFVSQGVQQSEVLCALQAATARYHH